MVRDIGRLVPDDERFAHQIPDTVSTVLESDLSWTEKVWATMTKKDGSLQAVFGLGKYPNRNVMDAYAGISRGKEQWTVRASRELAQDVERAQVGPICYEIIEPMKRIRLSLGRNEIISGSFEIEFMAALPPFLEQRRFLRQEGNPFRVASNLVRYHQAGDPVGWIELDGDRVTVSPEEWFGFRDHSWGVRPGVGQQPEDLAPHPRPGTGFVYWGPFILERPDGERFGIHHAYEQLDERTNYQSTFINHADGSQEPVVSVERDFEFDDISQGLSKGTLRLCAESGRELVVAVDAVGDSGFYLGSGLYPEFHGVRHGMWQGPLHIDGEYIPDCTESEIRGKLHQTRDRPVAVEAEDARGYGIVHTRIWGTTSTGELTHRGSS